MECKEAVDLLKDLVKNDLAQPSLVSIQETRSGKFSLTLKDDRDGAELRRFVSERNLSVDVDAEKRYFVIYKP